MKKNSGFTLIELLVVVAIIGILASVVLASLNSARGKGADAAIKGELSSLRAQAEIVYDSVGSYGTAAGTNCATDAAPTGATASSIFADAGIVKLTTSLTKRNSNGINCSSTTTAWAVAADLTQGGSWCVDSTGSSAKNAGAAAGAITANACN